MKETDVARRRFMGRVAVLLGYAGLGPLPLSAQGRAEQTSETAKTALPDPKKVADYDKLVKLANNENAYGPPEAVMKAMNDAWKYGNRYAAPDGGLVDAIAEHHKVKPENVLLGCGSSEILKVVDDAFLPEHKLVVGVEPTYNTVYQYATNSKAKAIATSLTKTYDANIKEIIRMTRANARWRARQRAATICRSCPRWPRPPSRMRSRRAAPRSGSTATSPPGTS